MFSMKKDLWKDVSMLLAALFEKGLKGNQCYANL